MKQNNEIRFKCLTEEHDQIQEKAKACGMSIKGFILYVCKNTKLKIEIE